MAVLSLYTAGMRNSAHLPCQDMNRLGLMISKVFPNLANSALFLQPPSWCLQLGAAYSENTLLPVPGQAQNVKLPLQTPCMGVGVHPLTIFYSRSAARTPGGKQWPAENWPLVKADEKCSWQRCICEAAAASWLFGRRRQGMNSTTAGSEADLATPNLLNTRDRTRVQLLPLATALSAITELIPLSTSTVVPPWQTSGKCCVYCIADWSVGKSDLPRLQLGTPQPGLTWRLWAQTEPSKARVPQHMVLAQLLAHIFFRTHYEGFINPAFGWNRALPKALSSNGEIVYKGSHSKFF